MHSATKVRKRWWNLSRFSLWVCLSSTQWRRPRDQKSLQLRNLCSTFSSSCATAAWTEWASSTSSRTQLSYPVSWPFFLLVSNILVFGLKQPLVSGRHFSITKESRPHLTLTQSGQNCSCCKANTNEWQIFRPTLHLSPHMQRGVKTLPLSTSWTTKKIKRWTLFARWSTLPSWL